MINISFIDRNLTQSLPDCLESGVLNEYDTAIIPFLREYFDERSTVQVSTSGSTGKPKLIELEKDRMVASAKATLDYFKLFKGQSILLCLPTQFIAGKMIWVRALEGQLDLMVSKPTSNPIKELNTKIDFAAMTPHQVSTCLAENPEKFDLIDQLIIGGGAVGEELLKQLQSLKTNCYATYGMTETITHVAVKKLNGKHKSIFYKAVGQTKFELGAKDNLIIYAPHLSQNKLETNDIVTLIDSTTFEWLGRLDFVVNSGGVKLFPEQIEKKLGFALKSNFFLWKEPDEILGERLILVVEGKEFDIPDLANLLPKLEQPKKVYFLDKFAYTQNGKLDRRLSFARVVRT